MTLLRITGYAALSTLLLAASACGGGGDESGAVPAARPR